MRYTVFLRQRYRVILGATGWLSLIASLLILSPLLLLPFYPGELGQAWGFLLPGLLLGLPSLFLWRRLAPDRATDLTRQEGTVVLVLTWLLVMVVGAIPFLATRQQTLTQALFESTSGWTTAGLSVLELKRASHLLLFYRSVIQLAGGAGLAILMLSLFSTPERFQLLMKPSSGQNGLKTAL